MGTIKDRNGMDLIEAEEIKRSGKNTCRTVQKGLNDPDNHNGVVSYIELECEVKWALGSIIMNKASGSD